MFLWNSYDDLMQGVGRTSRELAWAALELARVSRLVYPRGGFKGWEPAELQVLLALVIKSDQTVGELAASLELKSPTVSNAVKRLAGAKPALVKAKADPSDARSKLLRVTAKGKALAERFLTHARPHLRTH